MIIFLTHIILALLLFRVVNWIGEHATDFGYKSTTLFEEPTESLALNFFLRALSPTVFTVMLSAAAVAAKQDELRINIYLIAVYYYLFRVMYIFAMGYYRIVSWQRFFLHSGIGMFAAFLAYHTLILPNQSLLPDVKTAGNELWLAIFAFLYAVGNKIPASSGPGSKRRNEYVRQSYRYAKSRFGNILDNRIPDERLRLTAYSILIFENYARPWSVRFLERHLPWKRQRTTGIMQVAHTESLSDERSVELGAEKLSRAWQAHAGEHFRNKVWHVISDYNRDEDYIARIYDIMEILAKRVEPEFEVAYKEIFE